MNGAEYQIIADKALCILFDRLYDFTLTYLEIEAIVNRIDMMQNEWEIYYFDDLVTLEYVRWGCHLGLLEWKSEWEDQRQKWLRLEDKKVADDLEMKLDKVNQVLKSGISK